MVQLNHPVLLPVYQKVHNYEHHPREGPTMTIISGGSGASRLSETLIRYTHNSVHILPIFDDGGSSRELRLKLGMPPPGDLRNRLMSLSDMSMSGNPEVSRLFRTRLPTEGTDAQLQTLLDSFIDEEHPQMKNIEKRYRRIIFKHLERFNSKKPADFDLRGGNIGNFVIGGCYLSVGDLESVIFEFSALAAVRGQVYPVCGDGDFHLQAELQDNTVLLGQSRITSEQHAPIRRLAIVEKHGEQVREVQPPFNPLAETALQRSMLVCFSMGSFYTSLISNLLVDGMGRAIRQLKRPKVFVANLYPDNETPHMTVSSMLVELHRYLRQTDPQPGPIEDYIQYVLVNDHGAGPDPQYVPVDLPAVRALGIEPIVLPLERIGPFAERGHDPQLVAATLLSLC